MGRLKYVQFGGGLLRALINKSEQLRPKMKKIFNITMMTLFLIHILRVERETTLVMVFLFLYF